MHVLYASNSRGVHDDRWVAAMRTSGCTVTPLRIDPADRGALSAVERLVGDLGIDAVVAGPLTTCTSSLAGVSVPLVGLSWGFDLHQMAGEERTSHSSWMTTLAGLIVDSESTRRIAETLGVESNRIELIPWGVDLEVFHPDGPPATHPGLPASARVVLSARAHEPLYRVGDIVAAFENGRNNWGDDVYLVVVNDGPLTPDLQAAAGDHTLFIGRVAEEDLAAWLRRSEVYVSASETDGSSVTLLQSMACGTPVLISDISGNREWIRDGENGRLFPLGDIEALCSALTEVLASPERLAGTGKALNEVRERADWWRNSPRLCTFLRRVSGLPPDE
jgi:glycosyltransferase involved in cell wall biosynthesis